MARRVSKFLIVLFGFLLTYLIAIGVKAVSESAISYDKSHPGDKSSEEVLKEVVLMQVLK